MSTIFMDFRCVSLFMASHGLQLKVRRVVKGVDSSGAKGLRGQSTCCPLTRRTEATRSLQAAPTTMAIMLDSDGFRWILVDFRCFRKSLVL